MEKTDVREHRSLGWFDEIGQDVRFGVRILWKRPVFTSIIILTLALGIGVNSAIFAVVQGVLMRPLPYPDSAHMVQVMKKVTYPWASAPQTVPYIEPNDYRNWEGAPQLPIQLAASGDIAANLWGTDEPERVRCGVVSCSFLPLLGITPQTGRNFSTNEDRIGTAPTVILSHELWQKKFPGDTNLIGRVIRLNQSSCTVIGILPPKSPLLHPVDLLLPLSQGAQIQEVKDLGIWASVIGKLNPHCPPEQAAFRLNSLYQAAHPGSKDLLMLASLQENIVHSVRHDLLVFLGATGFVLLIACANVANLLLVSAAGRQKEIALRAALGAGRLRIARQLLTESVLLGALGGLAGLLVAIWTHDAIRLLPLGLPEIQSIRLDGGVLVFTLALSLATGIGFGLVPAWGASRASLSDAIKEGGRGEIPGRRHHWINRALVVGEVGLAVVMLLGTGLLLKSFISVRSVDPGYKPNQILSFTVDLGPRYPNTGSQVEYINELIHQLQMIPGVEAVGVNASMPLSPYACSGNLEEIEGFQISPKKSELVFWGTVNADYFKTMGIPLLSGRSFGPDEREGSPNAIIVDDFFVRRYFPNQNPIGKHVDAKTIVGVVGTVHPGSLDKKPEFPQIYQCYSQAGAEFMSIAVRTSGDPMKLAKPVRDCVLRLNPQQPLFSLTTLEETLHGTFTPRLSMIYLLSLFAAMAVGLAALGIYGVMWHMVADRSHEIGIRMALGATRVNVMMMVLKQGLTLTFTGIFLGLLCGVGLTRVIANQLFGVSPVDPTTFAFVTLGLIGVSSFASFWPAWRATNIDPLVSVRSGE